MRSGSGLGVPVPNITMRVDINEPNVVSMSFATSIRERGATKW
jgi:hypothetical protein